MSSVVAAIQAVLPLVELIRSRQSNDGSIKDPQDSDTENLKKLAAGVWPIHEILGSVAQAEAFQEDVNSWCAAGLETKPDFGRTRDALVPPKDGESVFFVGPVQTTNSVPPVGKRMDCFLARRREPDALAEISTRYPHPKDNCQATQLIIGSSGFSRGNCIVFFPENVAAASKLQSQSYAMFFFSKFRKIHETFTIPSARSILTADSLPTESTGLSAEESYQARALWGYVHDCAHYHGKWPLDKNISLKMNWFVGVLEELKVDAKTIQACAARDVPYADEQIAMIFLERIFRYALASDATRNFDAGTGVFLFSWLREHNALLRDGERYRLHLDRAIDAMTELVNTVESLEQRVQTEEQYRTQAKSLVRQFLQEGEGKEKYRFSDEQQVLLRPRAELDKIPALQFAVNEM